MHQFPEILLLRRRCQADFSVVERTDWFKYGTTNDFSELYDRVVALPPEVVTFWCEGKKNLSTRRPLPVVLL